MIREAEVRERLAAVIEELLPLPEFEDWLIQASWNMHRDSDPSAQDLVSAVELALSEYSSGHVSLAELRSELASFLDEIFVSFNISGVDVYSERFPRFRANSYQAQGQRSFAIA